MVSIIIWIVLGLVVLSIFYYVMDFLWNYLKFMWQHPFQWAWWTVSSPLRLVNKIFSTNMDLGCSEWLDDVAFIQVLRGEDPFSKEKETGYEAFKRLKRGNSYAAYRDDYEEDQNREEYNRRQREYAEEQQRKHREEVERHQAEERRKQEIRERLDHCFAYKVRFGGKNGTPSRIVVKANSISDARNKLEALGYHIVSSDTLRDSDYPTL